MKQVYLPLDPVERAERANKLKAAATKRWRQRNVERVRAYKQAKKRASA